MKSSLLKEIAKTAQKKRLSLEACTDTHYQIRGGKNVVNVYAGSKGVKVHVHGRGKAKPLKRASEAIDAAGVKPASSKDTPKPPWEDGGPGAAKSDVQVAPTDYSVSRPARSLLRGERLYRMTDEEADTAFEAISHERVEALCECDDDVGYTCARCRRLETKGIAVGQRNIDVAHQLGNRAKRVRVQPQRNFDPVGLKDGELLEATRLALLPFIHMGNWMRDQSLCASDPDLRKSLNQFVDHIDKALDSFEDCLRIESGIYKKGKK
ncbi:MAG: hypothetical protein AAF989_17550 [Planctomycetota bacterium]